MYITTGRAAQLLEVTTMTVRTWIAKGVIRRDEWRRPGGERGLYRVKRSAIDRLLYGDVPSE